MTDDRRVALAEKVARLSPEKQRLLRERLAGGAAQVREAELAPGDPELKEFPLSQTQAGFWFLQQLEPGGHMFNLPSFMRFYGVLDVQLVRRVLAEMLRRHELLRASVVADGAEPRLRVHAEVEVPMREVDLSHLGEEQREPELRRLASLECRAPFDLERAPLVRLLVIRERPDQSAACFTFHHIICDGWSVELFVRECLTLYLAYRSGAPSPLPPLRWRYADYVAWQRTHLTQKRLADQLEFWRTALGGAPTLLELPLDRPRPALASRDGSVAQAVLGAEDVERVTSFSRRAGFTPFMTYAGLFGLLLARYSGQEQVLLGTPVFNRPRPEFDQLIGLFINTLVIHCDLRGDPDVQTYLERVQKCVLDAFSHQDVPFHEVVRAVSPERHLTQSPLFQVLFSYQSYSSEVKVNAEGLRVRGLEGIEAKATYDLTFELRNRDDGALSIAAEFAGELFERATIIRMLGHYTELLRAAVEQPRRSVWSVPFLPAAERRRQVHDWNRTRVEYPRARCYHELFRAVAAQQPTAPAAVEGPRVLSYAELDARSDALAARLRGLGLVPERLALLLQERGLALLTSILAVFKAGAAYVPIDTAYPPERVAQLVRRCAAPVLVAREASRALVDALAAQGAWDERTRVLYAHELELGAAAPPVSSGGTPDNLAYCIFTSGSTGQPKGALIEQRGMLNHLFAKVADLQLCASDVLAATASPCFDISVWQFLAAPLVGARVSFFDDETTHTSLLFLRRLEDEGITIAEVVPSFFRVLLEDLERLGEARPAFSRLRYLLLTGEALPAPLCDRWLELYPRIPLVNAYGPTECSDDVTHHFIHQPLFTQAGPTPIGRPIANTQIYVVDRLREPLPVGVAGEVLVGGEGVGRGYLDDPARTAEAFVPDHLSQAAGGRLYRTGDLGRFHADGTLDYLGRLDHQIKLRGFRIELGEIETALATHPGVHAAAAQAHTDAAGRTRLVGYYVARQGHDVAAEECAAYLQQRLPAYMVPQVFLRLEALPLGATGKVDRKALPVPGPDALERARRFVPPSTPTEQRVAAVWAEVIGCGRVGAEDGFFELGGHSLMGTQVLSRVNAAFGLQLELRLLFESDTLAAFAREVDDALRAASGTALPPVERIAPGDERPLSFAQQRLWFLHEFDPTPAYNIPFTLRVKGALDLDRLAASLEQISARHEVLRTTIERREGRPVQVVQPPGPFALGFVDLSHLDLEAARAQALHLAGAEAARLFDLVRDPMLRVTAIRVAGDETLLAAAVHHIAFDGWSVALLVRELFELYAAWSEGREPQLRAPAVQYADFAAWQRRLLTGERRERQLSYWRTALDGAPTTLALPTDRPRGPSQTFDGGVWRFSLDASCTAALRASARATHTTLFMNLLAVLGVLLARWSDQDEMLIGTPVAARPRVELEPLIGLFVNTLVLRLDLRGEPGFHELLGRVRGACLDAYAHQDLPFEQLVEDLAPLRLPSHSPFFQVMLAMQTAVPPSLRLRDLEVEAIHAETGVSKFDLTLTVVEDEQALQCELEYNRDLFDAATVERLALHYTRLVRELCNAPERPVAQAPMLSPDETRELVEEFNDTAVAFEPQPVHRYLERRAALEPGRPAVSRGARTLSQGELHGHANALARFLAERGAGRGRVVALHMERSLELVVAILATLKAGAAYIPIPRSSPPQRVAHALRDSGAVLLLQDRGAPGVDGAPETHAVDLAWIDALGRVRGDLDVPVQPDDLCYVIYTSGSTGLPKGAAVRHSGQANTMTWFTSAFDVTADDRYLLLSSIGFDLTQKSIFGPLMLGAEVVLPIHDEYDPASLRRTLRERAVSVLTCTPTAFYGLLGDNSDQELAELASLRHVVLGGEPINVHRLLPWKHSPHCRAVFSNSYGPTECSDIVAAHVLSDEDFEGRRPVPIGRPIRNTQLYVVGRHAELLPAGCVGELWIGGLGVGPGYVAAPELNAERFVEAAFAPPGLRRVYRTGDLARRRPDGTLEYLGRQDHQVKLRGLRIELGELEALLEAHPAVRACAVVVHGQAAQPEGLAAYVERDPGAAPATAAELRAHLSARVPAYMLPQWWVFMDALPTGANGKIDRLALPAPDAGAVIRRAYSEPRSGLERGLAGIFADVTGSPRVGREDDFFELGGHSLLALRVLAQVRALCGVELALPEFFAHSDVAALAALVDSRAAASPLVIPVRGARTSPLSFAQEAMWLHERAWGVGSAYNMPYRFELRGTLDVPALEAALQHVVSRHHVLRSRVRLDDGGASQWIDDHVGALVQRLEPPGDTLDERRQAAERLADDEAERVFDLERDLPLRVKLFSLGEREHLLCLTLHHIAFDAWSEHALLSEMSAAYAAFHAGRPPEPAPAGVQYGDFAAWQRARIGAEELARHRAGLQALVEAYEPLFPPRGAGGGPGGERFEARRLSFALPASGLERARRSARASGASVFAVLCAAYARTLQRLTGRARVLINVPYIERPTVPLQEALGLFVWNPLLSLDAAPEHDMTELIAQVRGQLRAGLRYVSFADFIHELPAPPNALTEIVFNLIDVPSPAVVQWDELELRPARHGSSERVRSFYTLQLALREYAGTPTCDITWRRDSLDEARVHALADAYRATLEELAGVAETER